MSLRGGSRSQAHRQKHLSLLQGLVMLPSMSSWRVMLVTQDTLCLP